MFLNEIFLCYYGLIHCSSTAVKSQQIITGFLINGLNVDILVVYPDFFVYLFITGHGMGSESSIKHYLVLALAVVSVLAVCILTVLILRRPTFCKKQRGTSSGGGGGGGHGQNDVPQIITSSSPASNMDALPLAMNTGIFVPGADYDLQDCHFQHQPIVGTQVFK